MIFKYGSYLISIYLFLYLYGNAMVRVNDADIKRDQPRKLKYSIMAFLVVFIFMVLAYNELSVIERLK